MIILLCIIAILIIWWIISSQNKSKKIAAENARKAAEKESKIKNIQTFPIVSAVANNVREMIDSTVNRRLTQMVVVDVDEVGITCFVHSGDDPEKKDYGESSYESCQFAFSDMIGPASDKTYLYRDYGYENVHNNTSTHLLINEAVKRSLEQIISEKANANYEMRLKAFEDVYNRGNTRFSGKVCFVIYVIGKHNQANSSLNKWE